MLGWIVRILFVIAAPITALFVARDALNFGLLQTFVAMLLVSPGRAGCRLFRTQPTRPSLNA
jgi:hypothetical protein